MSHWWRAYDDAINHPKLLRLSDAMHRAWFTLQCIASANGGKLPPADDIAVSLRVKPARIRTWIEALRVAGLMDEEDGVFTPHNWHSRQFKSDVSTERVQRFRGKTRNGQRNVSETASETAPEQKQRTDTEQSRADAPAAVDEDLKRKAQALGAGISAHFLARHCPVPDLSRCEYWLREGYATGTVLAAIETVLKRGKAISTLEYFDGAIKDQHAKAPAPATPQVVSSQEFIIEGTLEWTCWDQHLRETTRKGSPSTDRTGDDGRVYRGWYRPTKFPPGYDEATGERLPGKAEDAA